MEALGGRGYLFSLPTVSVATRGPQHADIVRRLAQERKREHRLAELLTLVEEYIARYVLLSLPEQRTATVLWTAHTWIVEQFDTTPYLAFLSPEKRSGKSRVLEVLDKLVARPWLTVRPSEAVLFRNIEARRVTLLLDEIDTIFGRKAGSNYEGIRAILNAGFRRGMNVPRCVGEGTNIQVVDFAVYGAKAFAGIGNLPDTVRDRSIILDMVRRASDEPVERFRFREASAAARPLREALERWAVDVDLSEARPEIPPELDDRAADGWEALLAVADYAGDGWPEEARRAARVLSAGRMEETASFGVRLLHDCRRVFDSEQTDRLTSERLVKVLTGMEESPWDELTPRRLAGKLRPYKINPTTVRTGDRPAKGYKREDFDDAWKRYLPTPFPSEMANDPLHALHSQEIPSMRRPAVVKASLKVVPIHSLVAVLGHASIRTLR